MGKRDTTARKGRHIACIRLAFLFLWMSTVGTLMHTHTVVQGSSAPASIHNLTASSDLDTDCGACDWILAVQAAIAVRYRFSHSSTSVYLPIDRIVLLHLSRTPLNVSLRAPPAL